MSHQLIQDGKYKYFEAGEGTPIIVLHGLMGGLSNFDGVAGFFPQHDYSVIIPELPLYSQN
ncbi:MAG TPA: alpha/beta hydrolase, partial [Flavobacterium sp.]|nr:alpha/beta hydrolase [Flavobacterium sp.]